MKITLAKPVTGPNGTLSEVEVRIPANLSALGAAPDGVGFGEWSAALFTGLPVGVVMQFDERDIAATAAAAREQVNAWDVVRKLRAALIPEILK